MSGQCQTAVRLNKSDLIRVFNLSSDRCQDNVRTVVSEMSGQCQTDVSDIKTAVREVIEAERNQLMKPLEEQALYRLGRIEQENIFLKAKVETLLQENQVLQEQVRALPGPSIIEEKEKDIQVLQGQVRDLEGLHRKEKEEKEKQIDLHRQEMEQIRCQGEEEGKNYLATIEELKRRLQQEEARPWYRKLFS